MNSVAYYEHARITALENQQVEEMIMTPKFAQCLEECTKEDLSTFKSNATQIANEFVNKTLTRTKDAINFLESKECTPDRDLIAACEETIKYITKADRDNFVLYKTELQESINSIIESIVEDIKEADVAFSDTIQGSFNTMSCGTMSSVVKSCNESFSEKTNLRLHSNDVHFKDILRILSEYKNFNINEYSISSLSENTNINVVYENAKLIKDTVIESTDYLVKAKDAITEYQIYNFKNKEDILNKFVFGKES